MQRNSAAERQPRTARRSGTASAKARSNAPGGQTAISTSLISKIIVQPLPPRAPSGNSRGPPPAKDRVSEIGGAEGDKRGLRARVRLSVDTSISQMRGDEPDMPGPADISRSELREFYEDISACLDAEALADFPSFFTEDAKYQVISRENHDDGLEHAPIFCLGRAMIEDRVTATVAAALYQPRSL